MSACQTLGLLWAIKELTWSSRDRARWEPRWAGPPIPSSWWNKTIHSHFEQTSRMLHHPHVCIRNLGSITRMLSQDQCKILKTVNLREGIQREEVTIVFAAIVGDFWGHGLPEENHILSWLGSGSQQALWDVRQRGKWNNLLYRDSRKPGTFWKSPHGSKLTEL